MDIRIKRTSLVVGIAIYIFYLVPLMLSVLLPQNSYLSRLIIGNTLGNISLFLIIVLAVGIFLLIHHLCYWCMNKETPPSVIEKWCSRGTDNTPEY